MRLVTPADVAALFGVNRKTVRRWIDSGDIPAPARTPKGHSRWPADQIATIARGLGYPVPEGWTTTARAA